MDDLRRRFGQLDLRSPELWPEIEARAAALRSTAGTAPTRRSQTPVLLFAAALVLVSILGAAVAVGSGLLRLPSVEPAPVPTASGEPTEAPETTPVARLTRDDAWPGEIRGEPRGRVSGTVPVFRDLEKDRLVHRDPSQDVATDSPWADLTLIEMQMTPTNGTDGVALYFELAGPMQATEIAAYGVVVDFDGDDRADYRIGMDNVGGSDHREWIGDLATGESSVNPTANYGWSAFGLFEDTYFPGHDDPPDSGHMIATIGAEGVRFYVFASTIDDDGNTITDFAPDVGWFEFFPNRSCEGGAC